MYTIAEGLLTKESYPFGKRKYEIAAGKNTKKALTLKIIALIYYHQPEPGSTVKIKFRLSFKILICK